MHPDNHRLHLNIRVIFVLYSAPTSESTRWANDQHISPLFSYAAVLKLPVPASSVSTRVLLLFVTLSAVTVANLYALLKISYTTLQVQTITGMIWRSIVKKVSFSVFVGCFTFLKPKAISTSGFNSGPFIFFWL